MSCLGGKSLGDPEDGGTQGLGVLPPVSTHSPPGQRWEASRAGQWDQSPRRGVEGCPQPSPGGTGAGGFSEGRDQPRAPLCCVYTRPRRVRVRLRVCAWAPLGGECAQVGPLSGCNSSPLPEPRGPFAGTAKRRDHADCSPSQAVCPGHQAPRRLRPTLVPGPPARQPACHTHTTHMHTWVHTPSPEPALRAHTGTGPQSHAGPSAPHWGSACGRPRPGNQVRARWQARPGPPAQPGCPSACLLFPAIVLTTALARGQGMFSENWAPEKRPL